MTVTVAVVNCSGPGLHFPQEEAFRVLLDAEPPFSLVECNNRDNSHSPCWWYQHIVENCDSDIIVYCHDDLDIHDADWVDRIKEIFLRESVVAVGLGGAIGLGNLDLYRKPFELRNMARIGYSSNQTDAETHGERFTGTRRVAVLDAFCMAVRRSWFTCRNWPVDHLTHHCLDLWLACEAARDRKEVWMTGVSCTHHGGGSSISPLYKDAKWLQGGNTGEDHERPHKWLWDEYRDVLPMRLPL